MPYKLSIRRAKYFNSRGSSRILFRGLGQVQANDQIGLTFSSILRSFLRQDPEVILVGEIRDKETVEIAIKAALVTCC